MSNIPITFPLYNNGQACVSIIIGIRPFKKISNGKAAPLCADMYADM